MLEGSKFGREFQLALLALVLTNKDVTAKLKHLEDLPKVFDDDLSRACVNIAIDFYDKYENVPTSKQLLFELEEQGHVQVQKVVQAIYNSKVENVNWYVDQVETFIQQQKFQTSLVKAAAALEQGNFNKAQDIIHEASKSTHIDKVQSFNVFESLREPYTEATQKIHTFIDPLDEALGGGIGVGELGLILAPPGVGKSMALCFFGTQAALHNYKVVHFTFELSAERTRMRYEASLTGIPSNELRQRFDEKCSKLEDLNTNNKFSNSIYIVEYPTKSCTIPMIQAHLDSLDAQGFTPDLIIVDYLNLIRWDPRLDKRDGLSSNTEGLRMIAGERKVPVWSATQAHRDAVNKVIYGLESVAECFEETMIADIVIPLCQTEDEYKGNTLRWFLAKNRNNRKGQEIESEYDFATVNLNIHSELL